MSNIYKGAGTSLSQSPVKITCPEPAQPILIGLPEPVLEDAQQLTQQAVIDEEILPDPKELVMAAKKEAEEIIAAAKREVEQQKISFEEDLKRRIEAEKKQAYEIGMLEGSEQKTQEIEQAIASLSNAVDEIKSNFNSFMDEQRSDLITLVLEVTEKILAKRIENDDYIMVPIIQKALQGVKIKSHCAISVSEDAGQLLAFLKKELMNSSDPDSAMFDVLAKDMPLDFCVLEVNEELLDLSISTQFENLGNFLKHND